MCLLVGCLNRIPFESPHTGESKAVPSTALQSKSGYWGTFRGGAKLFGVRRSSPLWLRVPSCSERYQQGPTTPSSGHPSYQNLFKKPKRFTGDSRATHGLTHGLTQEEAAQLTGLSYKHYQSIESGRNPNLWLNTVDKTATGYRIESAALIEKQAP